ncbi:hypothetical protein [Aliarcobacter butzleri]|uniref:hypothetical protein n=1 Tax=Aliarcobacter butzleri TaxID=28197 RepID=UPI002B2454F7|nr:hypothetical protein [Aliarcobacter butzleri]
MSKKPELKQWVEKKVSSNPTRYGSDLGNSYIILDYLIETNPELNQLNRLTLEAISESVAVSRIKNQYLEENPQYDFRDRWKSKRSFIKKDLQDKK